MERVIDLKIGEIKGLILQMSGYVEKSLTLACEGIERRDVTAFGDVHKLETNINRVQMAVDNECLNLIATQGPVAKDLRYIFSILKINTDLERMGDLCVNIAYSGKDFLGFGKSYPTQDLLSMSKLVRGMVGSSFDCFVNGNLKQAEEILLSDDEVDALRDHIEEDLIERMKASPQEVEPSLLLLSMTRNLERIGDHATNIAEDVIFAFTGKDIRHGGRFG